VYDAEKERLAEATTRQQQQQQQVENARIPSKLDKSQNTLKNSIRARIPLKLTF
jgi:hypothetical protein